MNCAQRECPYGLSWVAANPDVTTLKIPAGGSLGGKHAYTECSSRGVCNRDSGECGASLDMREEDAEDRLARTTALDTIDVACTTTRSILQ